MTLPPRVSCKWQLNFNRCIQSRKHKGSDGTNEEPCAVQEEKNRHHSTVRLQKQLFRVIKIQAVTHRAKATAPRNQGEVFTGFPECLLVEK